MNLRMIRPCLVLALLLLASPAWAMTYLGDFADDATVYCTWSTNAAAGASITRATNGTIHVYKDGATGTETTTGVTDSEDFDGETGVHLVTVATTDAFYATGSEYFIILKDAVIDGQAVSHPLCQFSIERAGGVLALVKGTGVKLSPGTGTGQVDLSSGRVKDDKPAVGRVAIKKGTTSYIASVYIESQLTGGPLTGLVFNSASLTAYYTRADQGNAGATVISLVTATRGSFTSSGFVEKDATNAPGWYEVGLPNAVLDTGSPWATVTLKGASNMKPATVFIELVDNVTSDVTTLIGTPAATVSTDIAAVKTDTAAILVDTGTDGVVVAAASKAGVGTYRKNVAGQRVHPIYMRATAGVTTGLTGASVTVTVQKDGAAAVAATGTVAEAGRGIYYFSPSQADTNCDTCVFEATAALAVPYIFYMFTTP